MTTPGPIVQLLRADIQQAFLTHITDARDDALNEIHSAAAQFDDDVEVARHAAATAGKSAFEIAQDNGFIGSIIEWLNSLEADPLTVVSSTVTETGTEVTLSDGTTIHIPRGPAGSIDTVDDSIRGMAQDAIDRAADNIAFIRGDLADGTDFNDVVGQATQQGVHRILADRTYLNAPFAGKSGSLLVISNALGQATQLAFEYHTHVVWVRNRMNAWTTPAVWSQWDQLALGRHVADQIATAAGEASWYRGVVPWNTTTLDALDDGYWDCDYIPKATSLGLPNMGGIYLHSNGHYRTAVLVRYDGRVYTNSRTASADWGAWVQLATTGTVSTALEEAKTYAHDISWHRGILPDGTDFNSLVGVETQQGAYRLMADYTYPNGPFPGEAGSLLVLSSGGGQTVNFAWKNGSHAFLMRSRINPWSTPNQWTEWDQVALQSQLPATGTDAATSAATHGTRREILNRAKGNRIGTQGKGVVCLRFDHAVDEFRELILPELVARDLPATQCHYVNEMEVESPNSTWADVQDAAIRHGIEAWAHSRTHDDATGYEAIKHELIDSKDDLEALLPLLEIPGLVVPGVTGTHFDGFQANMSSPSAFTDYEAGRMIAAKYAACTSHGGMLNSPGTALGIQYYFVDTATNTSQVEGLINEAAATESVTVISLHPHLVNTGSNITVETYRDMLDLIVQARDEGRIEVLTMSGATVADPTTRWRQNICRGLGTWQLYAGWARDANGLHGVGATSAAVLPVNSWRWNWGEGHTWEAWVDVEGTGTVDLQLTLSSQQINLTRTQAGAGRMRIPFTIPKDEASLFLRLWVTEGEATITDAGIHPI